MLIDFTLPLIMECIFLPLARLMSFEWMADVAFFYLVGCWVVFYIPLNTLGPCSGTQ